MFLIVVKLLVTIGVVLGISSIAERGEPPRGGDSGRISARIVNSSIFFGIENGAVFAAQSAVYMTAGLVAELVFLFCYYKISSIVHGDRVHAIVLSSVGACIGFVVVIWLLHTIDFNLVTATLTYLTGLLICIFLFRTIRDTTIETRIQLNVPTILCALFWRALLCF